MKDIKYGLDDLYMVIFNNKNEIIESEITFKSFKELTTVMKFLDRNCIRFELLSYTFLNEEIEKFKPSWMPGAELANEESVNYEE